MSPPALPSAAARAVARRPASQGGAGPPAWTVVRLAALGTATVLVAGSLAACGNGGGDGGGGSREARTGGSAEGPPGDTGAGATGGNEREGRAAVIDPGDGGRYAPVIDPADFVAESDGRAIGIDNPYLPLEPGRRCVYEGTDDGDPERIEVEVTGERRQVLGIPAVVVRDTVTAGGELVEDTYDWFAQDRAGNVWYLGEDTTEYEDGEASSTEGSWEAGVDGAQPGIVMPAAPAPGQAYRQEFDEGEAEDMAEVLRLGESVQVPAGGYDDVLVIREWTPLEPEVVEEKSYAPGVGLVLETKVAGGSGRIELVSCSPGR